MKDPDLLLAVKPVVQVFSEPPHIMALLDRLKKNYYIDEAAIDDAIKRGSSFNLIHLEISIKIDVFVPRDEIYHYTAMERRHRDTLFEENSTTEVYFCSPEDIIIYKLQWYKGGGGVSERQWLDVSGVIKVQAESLDTTYLLRWSKDLGLYELLVRAFEEAGVPLQS